MRKRSSKILAASLSLLIGLNGMPFSALAVENDPTQTATEQTVQEEPAGEPASGSQEQSGEAGPATEPATEQEQPEATEPVVTEPEQKENPPQETGEPQQPAEEAEAAPAESDEEKAESSAAGAPADGAETQPQTDPAVPEEEGPSAAPAQQAAKAAEETPQEEPSTMLMGAENLNEDTIYVSADGADGAYSSLKEAVDAAISSSAQQVTIELQSDITVTENARIRDTEDGTRKDIVLDGNGFTITRGDEFLNASDNNRSWYSPAMIEVTTPNGAGTSLTLVDVTLDDAGKAKGTIFAQAPGGGVSSDGYVQDAIIAAYGTDKSTAQVILGNGAVLQNFGGMSAVRVTGGATLTMQSGSKIQDTATVSDRVLGADGSNGPAGAVWVQGTTAVMEEGAEITNMVGRAFYVDGGTVTIGGKITGIQADGDMWQGTTGIALHLRGGGKATLTATAYIGDIETNASSGSVLGIYGSDLDMQQGAVLKNVKGISALYMDDMGNNYTHVALVNGTVDGVENNPVMRSWYGHIDLGPTSVVQNCTASQVLYTNNGSRYTFEGKILNNTGTAVYLANQSGGRVEAVMKEGAVISGTQGLAVRVNNGSLFTMEGGEISGNESGVEVSGKPNAGFAGVTFIMNGGRIVQNTVGVIYEVLNQSKVQLNGGEIAGNTGAQIVATGSDKGDAKYAVDAYQNFDLEQGVLKNDPIVQVEFGTMTLDDDYKTISMGQAAPETEAEIARQVTATAGQEKWKIVGKSLWFKMESANSLHFTMTRPSAVDQGVGLYAGYLPLKADGTPADGAELTLVRLANTDTLDITLKGLTAGTSYALMLVVSDKYYVTVKPADITVYMGGEHGYNGVVSGNNSITASDSLPTPGFTFDLPKGVTDISQVTFREVNGTKTWKAEPYDHVKGHEVYKLVAQGEQPPVRMQFTDESGNLIVEDKFTVGTQLNKTFTMELYKGAVEAVEAVVDGDTSGTTYGIVLNTGTLTVRGTTGGVQFSKMNSPAETGKPAVRADGKVTFTINGSDVEANQNSIALLFDYIIEKTPSEADRSALLAKKADEVLNKAIPAGMVRNYNFRYLDLVDTSNGNTWVEARDENGEIAEVTVSWPYPEGTDQNTEFTLLHFEGLHRDMNSNEVAGDIAGCTVTPVSITKTATHIEFTTKGFSPFALVWDGEQAVTPPAGGETEETQEGGSGDTGSTTPQATAKPATPTAAAPAAQPAAVIPQTGDESNPLLWVVLLAISGSLGTALVLKRRKEQ